MKIGRGERTKLLGAELEDAFRNAHDAHPTLWARSIRTRTGSGPGRAPGHGEPASRARVFQHVPAFSPILVLALLRPGPARACFRRRSKAGRPIKCQGSVSPGRSSCAPAAGQPSARLPQAFPPSRVSPTEEGHRSRRAGSRRILVHSDNSTQWARASPRARREGAALPRHQHATSRQSRGLHRHVEYCQDFHYSAQVDSDLKVSMILPQEPTHLRKPCFDYSFLLIIRV